MGKEAQVIEWLYAHLDGQSRDIRRQITIQSNRFQKLKRKRLEGSIDRNSANVESSQISGILLEILDNYAFEAGKSDRTEDSHEEKSLDNQPKKSPRLASVGMLLLGIALVSASGLLIWNLLGVNSSKEGGEKPSTAYDATDWLGFWEVDFIHEGKDRKANLMLKLEGAKWSGSIKILAEGRDAAYDLILDDFQWSENFLWFLGTWRTEINFIPAMKGEFKLALKEEGKAFEGYFKNNIESGQKNSWKGRKK